MHLEGSLVDPSKNCYRTHIENWSRISIENGVFDLDFKFQLLAVTSRLCLRGDLVLQYVHWVRQEEGRQQYDTRHHSWSSLYRSRGNHVDGRCKCLWLSAINDDRSTCVLQISSELGMCSRTGYKDPIEKRTQSFDSSYPLYTTKADSDCLKNHSLLCYVELFVWRCVSSCHLSEQVYFYPGAGKGNHKSSSSPSISIY